MTYKNKVVVVQKVIKCLFEDAYSKLFIYYIYIVHDSTTLCKSSQEVNQFYVYQIPSILNVIPKMGF